MPLVIGPPVSPNDFANGPRKWVGLLIVVLGCGVGLATAIFAEKIGDGLFLPLVLVGAATGYAGLFIVLSPPADIDAAAEELVEALRSPGSTSGPTADQIKPDRQVPESSVAPSTQKETMPGASESRTTTAVVPISEGQAIDRLRVPSRTVTKDEVTGILRTILEQQRRQDRRLQWLLLVLGTTAGAAIQYLMR